MEFIINSEISFPKSSQNTNFRYKITVIPLYQNDGYSLVDLKRFELSTPTMRMWCAPNCATSPCAIIIPPYFSKCNAFEKKFFPHRPAGTNSHHGNPVARGIPDAPIRTHRPPSHLVPLLRGTQGVVCRHRF